MKLTPLFFSGLVCSGLALWPVTAAAQTGPAPSAAAVPALPTSGVLPTLAPLTGLAPLIGLALLPDGTRLVCAGAELRQLSPQGELLRRIQLPEPCLSLQVSPAGTLALTVGRGAARVWRLADGQVAYTLSLSGLAGRVAFLSEGELLLGTGRGVESLKLADRQRRVLLPGAVSGLALAPGGERLLLSRGERLDLVRLSDFKVLSGIRCEELCPLRRAQFSADGRGAVALAGSALYALREGRPVNVVVRGVEGDASGFPLPDGGVWVLRGGQVERRDAQTGRREGRLLDDAPANALLDAPASWNGAGGVLLLTQGHDLLELGPDGREVSRQPLGF